MSSKNKSNVLNTGSLNKEFIIDSNSCSGCRLCELICSLRKKRCFNPEKAYIKIIKNFKFKVYFPIFASSCDACGGVPACVDICPTKSISYMDEESAVCEINKAGKFPALYLRGTNEFWLV